MSPVLLPWPHSTLHFPHRTHRSTAKAVPSLCSLVKAVHLINYEEEGRDDHELGAAVRDMTRQLLICAQDDLQEMGTPLAHVNYNRLIADPKAVVKAIYKQFGWQYTEEFEALMDEYIAEDTARRAAQRQQQQQAVMHSYSPEEFGLTEDELLHDPVFQQYNETFCQ